MIRKSELLRVLLAIDPAKHKGLEYSIKKVVEVYQLVLKDYGEVISRDDLLKIMDEVSEHDGLNDEKVNFSATMFVSMPLVDLIRKDDQAKLEVLPELRPHDLPKSGPGSRTKFGGHPDFIQLGGVHPSCPQCKKPMTFLCQIDSFEMCDNLSLKRTKGFMFGDAGMLYIFRCHRCERYSCSEECY